MSKRFVQPVHVRPQRTPSRVHRPVALQAAFVGPVPGPAPVAAPQQRRKRGR